MGLKYEVSAQRPTSKSLGKPSAVNGEIDPRDVARGVGQQKLTRSDEVVRLAPPAKDRLLGSGFARTRVVLARAGHRRGDVAGAQAVHTNAKVTEVDCHRSCQLPQCGLRRLVGGVFGEALVGAEARDVDDRPSTPAGRLHRLGSQPAEAKWG